MQLHDNNNDVLMNLSLPNDEIRYQLLEWLYGSIEETKEVAKIFECLRHLIKVPRALLEALNTRVQFF